MISSSPWKYKPEAQVLKLRFSAGRTEKTLQSPELRTHLRFWIHLKGVDQNYLVFAHASLIRPTVQLQKAQASVFCSVAENARLRFALVLLQ